jgi:hypothetical protein
VGGVEEEDRGGTPPRQAWGAGVVVVVHGEIDVRKDGKCSRVSTGIEGNVI